MMPKLPAEVCSQTDCSALKLKLNAGEPVMLIVAVMLEAGEGAFCAPVTDFWMVLICFERLDRAFTAAAWLVMALMLDRVTSRFETPFKAVVRAAEGNNPATWLENVLAAATY